MHRHNIRGEKMTYGAYIDMPRSEKPTKIDRAKSGRVEEKL